MVEKNTEVNIEYKIKLVEAFPIKPGYVAMLLAPCRTIETRDAQKPPVRIHNVGGNGAMGMQMFEMNIGSLMERERNPEQCREVIIVLPEIDYFGLDWGYGDIIKGNFKKVLDAKENVLLKEDEECPVLKKLKENA